MILHKSDEIVGATGRSPFGRLPYPIGRAAARPYEKYMFFQKFHRLGTKDEKLQNLIGFLYELRIFHDDEFFQPPDYLIFLTTACCQKCPFAMRKYRDQIDNSAFFCGENCLRTGARLIDQRKKVIR